jgi:Tfp pilus assembly protein PilX
MRHDLPSGHRSRTGARALLRERLQSMRGPEADRGQALVFALIVVLVAILVPTVMVSNLQRQIPVVTSEMNFDAALAATQAGIQSYRNLLNAYPSYWQYNSSSTIPAGEGGANQALTGWETVPRSSPTESFTYSPDTSQLSAAAGGQLSGDVLLTVIGRAGTTGAQTSYRRIQAALSLSGVLTDVYYSNYEQPGTLDSDQWDQNVYPTGSTNQSSVCSANGSCSAEAYDEVTDNLSYAPVGSPTPSVATTTESASTALCLYDAYQPNQFIDWYSQYKSPIYPPSGGGYPNSSTAYNTTTNQYYGPWYGTFSDPLSSGYQFGLTGNPSLGSCNVNYWITGDSFNGPVYSQDELTTCGQPTFTGTPSLQTAVSKLFDFPANWPGTKPASGGFSNPYGYVQDPFGICGSSDTPTFNDPLSPRFAVNQSLPPLANELKSEIETGHRRRLCLHRPDRDPFLLEPQHFDRADGRLEPAHAGHLRVTRSELRLMADHATGGYCQSGFAAGDRCRSRHGADVTRTAPSRARHPATRHLRTEHADLGQQPRDLPEPGPQRLADAPERGNERHRCGLHRPVRQLGTDRQRQPDDL